MWTRKVFYCHSHHMADSHIQEKTCSCSGAFSGIKCSHHVGPAHFPKSFQQDSDRYRFYDQPHRFHLPLGELLTWSTAWISWRQELRKNRKHWLMIGWKRWASNEICLCNLWNHVNQHWRFVLVSVESSYWEVFATLVGFISCGWVTLYFVLQSVCKSKTLNIMSG